MSDALYTADEVIDILEHLNERLADRRAALGQSCRQAGKDIGTSPSLLLQWEKGKTEFTVPSACKVLRWLLRTREFV